jgi:UDP-N-acetylglucosamine transferase subunit ALG13
LIFVTVGTQLPFDRLIRAVDAALDARPAEVLFQIGKGSYLPRNGRFQRVMDGPEFKAAMRAATVVVSHAGIGSILASRQHRTPALLMPRKRALGEHRNDHQSATARSLAHLTGLYVAWDEADVARLLAERLEPPVVTADDPMRVQLKDTLAAIIRDSV